MTISKKYCVRIVVAASIIGLCGMTFWQWSRHDTYLGERAFRAAICNGRVCETSSERSEFISKYARDGNMHAWIAIVLVPAAVFAGLTGGVGFAIAVRKPFRLN